MPESRSQWDVAIIGAGAAGLMGAIFCARAGLQVLLLDGKEKIGAKILMSGGTRCNVTNQKVTESDFESEELRTVRNILRSFPSDKAVSFFKTLGVELILEPGGKYFPSTHSARTVLKALSDEIYTLGVHLSTGKKITELSKGENDFILRGDGFEFRAKTVLLCSGGLSYPGSGSDGTGYGLALALGHSLISTSPALTPLTSADEDWKSISGVALPVSLSLWLENRKIKTFEGAFLFTHFGFSGPSALNISRYWIRSTKEQPKVTADFLPSIPAEKFKGMLEAEAKSHPSLLLKNYLKTLLPERFILILLRKAGVSEGLNMNQLSRVQRDRLFLNLFSYPLPVSGVLGYAKAEVTAGGIPLAEVDSRTLESKKIPGLFFAGEILDVDGRIGGFNFQWAWSSGVAAAHGIKAKIKRV